MEKFRFLIYIFLIIATIFGIIGVVQGNDIYVLIYQIIFSSAGGLTILAFIIITIKNRRR